MTREEAKTEIMQIYGSLSEEKKQALDVLMAQADGEYDGVYISYDLISRQAVIEAIYDMEILKYRIDLEKVIKELPSVAIPKTCDLEKSNFDIRQYKLDTDTAYECGFKAGLKTRVDGDLISRSRMLADLKENYEFMTVDGYADLFNDFIEFIKRQPSVAIPSKVGQWIYDGTIDNWRCIKCDKPPKIRGYVGTLEFMEEHFKYCPNCGADMRGDDNEG